MDVRFEPVTPERWDDLEALFGPSGAYSGCWCMWWRITAAEFERNGNAGNRAAFKAICDAGQVPGLVAYGEGEPVGWISVAPREEFGRILRSPDIRPIDDEPAWSIVCFAIARRARRQGVATALIAGAIDYAREQGATLLEAYPTPANWSAGAAAFFTGTNEMFEAAGFEEAAKRKGARYIYRKRLDG